MLVKQAKGEKRIARVLSVLGLCCLWLGVMELHAAPSDDFTKYNQQEFEHTPDPDDEWRELRWQVPEPPPEDALEVVAFDRTPPGMKFYAAPESFDIGEDRITRFWLFTRSDRGGDYHGTYYGLRCATRELKTYAFSHPRRQPRIRPHPSPSWKPLRPRSFEREMGKYWFCADGFALDNAQIGRNVRHGVNLMPRTFIDNQ